MIITTEGKRFQKRCAMNQFQFLVGVVLSGVALGCETESQAPATTTYYGGSEVRVLAPDGRTFIGGEPARVEVHPSIPLNTPDQFTFVVQAGVAGGSDPTGRLHVGFAQPADSIVNPELIELQISPGNTTVVNEIGPISSGRVHLELRAGRMTGRVDTPDGTYTIDGSLSLLCVKREGDHGVVDESLETPLCQRFANLKRPL